MAWVRSVHGQLSGDFIHALASGRDGQGARCRIGPVPSAGPEYRMRLDAEAGVLSNGLLRFSFNLMRCVGGPPTRLSSDLQGLALELLETLEEDYRTWSSGQPGYSQSPR